MSEDFPGSQSCLGRPKLISDETLYGPDTAPERTRVKTNDAVKQRKVDIMVKAAQVDWKVDLETKCATLTFTRGKVQRNGKGTATGHCEASRRIEIPIREVRRAAAAVVAIF